MPTYNNPANMIPERPWMAGGMRGAVAGLNGAYSMQASEQNIKDNDLEFLRNMEKYKQEQDATPTMAAENELKRKLAALDSGMVDDGTAEAVSRAKAAQTISNSEETISGNAQKQKERKDALLVELVGEHQRSPFDMKSEAGMARWNDYRQKFKALGTEFPAAPSPEDWMHINAKAQAIVNNAPTQRSMAEIKETGNQTRQTQLERDTRAATAAQDLERLRQSGQQDLAKIRSAGQLSVAEIKAQMPKTFMAAAVKAFETKDMALVDMHLESWISDIESKSATRKLEFIQNPEARDLMKAKAFRAVMEAAQGSGTTSQPSAPKAESGGEPPRQPGMPEKGTKRADGAIFDVWEGKWRWKLP